MIVRIVPIIPVVSNTGRSYGYTTRMIANDPDDWEDLDGLDRIEWTPLKSKKKNNNNTTAKMFAPKFKFSDLDRVWANGETYHYNEANDHRCFLRFSRSLRASSPKVGEWNSLARSREARFACPNRRACSQANSRVDEIIGCRQEYYSWITKLIRNKLWDTWSNDVIVEMVNSGDTTLDTTFAIACRFFLIILCVEKYLPWLCTVHSWRMGVLGKEKWDTWRYLNIIDPFTVNFHLLTWFRYQ